MRGGGGCNIGSGYGGGGSGYGGGSHSFGDNGGGGRGHEALRRSVTKARDGRRRKARVDLFGDLFAFLHRFDVLVDEHANLVVVWTGGPAKRGGPKRANRTLAFSAHLDHPGFLVEGRRQGH